MVEKPSNPDCLKPLSGVLSADPRSDNQSVLDILQPGEDALDEHHRAVAEISLTSSVPEDVNIQFETAKNLYLYAWFVYRFFPIAEHHALTCLEFGLRQRFPKLPKKYWDKPWMPTLRPLLRFAVDSQAIKNEGFRQWRDQVSVRAQQRYSLERQTYMREEGLSHLELDYSQAIPNDEDNDWDYLSILLEVLPGIRNHYAHGSAYLHNQVLGTLELVSEILNQLFDVRGQSK